MVDRKSVYDTSPMAEAEARLGIQPIDELLDQRRHLVDKVADLRAQYGSFGTFDHLRKIELARIAGLIRAQAVRDHMKMTAAEVDDATHDHPDYRDLITRATRERAQWVRLEAEIEAIDATINRGQAVARFAAAEARL
jgi:hypothetical protein